MRKYKRAIARHAMKKAGIERMNKPPIKSGSSRSFFSANWRRYLPKV